MIAFALKLLGYTKQAITLIKTFLASPIGKKMLELLPMVLPLVKDYMDKNISGAEKAAAVRKALAIKLEAQRGLNPSKIAEEYPTHVMNGAIEVALGLVHQAKADAVQAKTLKAGMLLLLVAPSAVCAGCAARPDAFDLMFEQRAQRAAMYPPPQVQPLPASAFKL